MDARISGRFGFAATSRPMGIFVGTRGIVVKSLYTVFFYDCIGIVPNIGLVPNI
jgi:hypothetical protein